jgi:hypothetical protein
MAILSFKGVLFSVILIVVAFFGLFFLPLCLLLYLLPFCGQLARTANDLLISSWFKLVPVSLVQPHHAPYFIAIYTIIFPSSTGFVW